MEVRRHRKRSTIAASNSWDNDKRNICALITNEYGDFHYNLSLSGWLAYCDVTVWWAVPKQPTIKEFGHDVKELNLLFT